MAPLLPRGVRHFNDEDGRGGGAVSMRDEKDVFPRSELWDFSLAVYAAPGVAPACLDLQARHGVDVNLLLAALWCGASGRGPLSEAMLAALRCDVAPLHDEVVRRLRHARTWLKPRATDDPRLEALRTRIKRAELDAEHCEQLAIEARLAAMPRVVPGHAERARDAGVGLDRCLASFGARADDRAAQRLRAAAAGWIVGTGGDSPQLAREDR